jgi:hypothetical protein
VKVNAYKNIDVEFEADIQIEDVLNELGDIANSEDGAHRKLGALDQLTRILERLDVCLLDTFREGEPREAAKALLRSRLDKWIDATDKPDDGRCKTCGRVRCGP